MKLLLNLAAVLLALSASSAFAQSAPMSDEFLFINSAGAVVSDYIIPETAGEAPTPVGLCLACSPGVLELLDPDGTLSDYVIFGPPNADGLHQMTFYSDVEGAPLASPSASLPVELTLIETGELQDITILFPRTLASGGHIFIRSDVEVPEPALPALIGVGVLALALIRRRRH
jgi:hypothetical protein